MKKLGVIPAAGRGVRFQELGRVYPKAVLPYEEVPIIVHTMRWMVLQGCDSICVVTGHQAEKVESTVNDYRLDDVHLSAIPVWFTEQKELVGLSGAVLAALNSINETTDVDSALVVLGDIVPDGYCELEDMNWVSVQKVPDYSRWCMVEVDEKEFVKRFIDKPQERPDTDLALSGVYFFSDAERLRELLDEQLQHGVCVAGEYQLSSVMQVIAEESGMFAKSHPHVTDFGTLAEFLDNRGVKGSRSFNDITVNGPFVHKYSTDNSQKIIDEMNWFDRMPDSLAVYTPRLFERDVYGHGNSFSGYTMEKVHAPTLRELFLFLDSSEETWSDVFDSVEEFLDQAKVYGRNNDFLDRMLDKTRKRVELIDISVEPMFIRHFMEYFEDVIERAKSTRHWWDAIVHGDLCFSNMFFDPTTKRIVLVDPRGALFGDQRYELAKLNHSARYKYDFIDAEMYRTTSTGVVLYDDGKDSVGELFRKRFLEGLEYEDEEIVEALTASLFLSMIPLHSHNTQNQELYYEIFRKIATELKV